MFNILGSILYFMTALLCIRAASAGGRSIDRRFWFGAALFFSALIAVRLFAIEDLFRDSLRAELRGEGIYGMRRELQAGLAVIAILVAAAMSIFVIRLADFRRGVRTRRAGMAVRWALLGMTAMIGVMMLRLISFHATDALLYRGPIRLNWILDIGATVLTGWASISYANAVKSAGGTPSSRTGRP